MHIVFHKWCQYLKTRDITKFLGLYCNSCHLVSNIKNNKYPETVLLPSYHEAYQKNRVGAFKIFENILFSPYREFDIKAYDVNYSEKNNTLHGSCSMNYKGEEFNTRHTMFVIKENNYDSIMFHYTDWEILK